MALAVKYTPIAKETLLYVYDFIQDRFGENVANKFLIKTEKTISLIAENPLMFKASAVDRNVRIGLITKHSSLFYEVTHDSVNLLFFWDNRQDPILF